MITIAIVLQIVIALGILNVWVLRYNKPTPFRPANASNMVEEFRAYRLPDWSRVAVGATKLTLAALLIIGIWYAPVAAAAAIGMAILMAGAVWAHVRVGDPWVKSVPAFTMLVLSTIVTYSYLI